MKSHPTRLRSSARNAALECLEPRVLFVRVEGIDVSQFQGTIDWGQVVASGKQFVFMRSSRTNLTTDPTFAANSAGAAAAGLLVGAYHFTLPNSFGEAGPRTDPVADAQKFFAAGGSVMDTGFLRPVIDAEAGNSLGKADLSLWVNQFSDELERLTGVKPIVYANINYAVNFLDETVAAEHDLWLARYNNGNDPSGVDPQSTQPDGVGFHPNPYGSWNNPYGGPRSDDSWDFWQYTSSGDGLATGVSSTDLDLDLFNGDLETLKRRFQIGYQKNFTPGEMPFAVGPGLTTGIEAENYDVGGADVSYADTSPAMNSGNVFRTSVREGVDLAPVGGLADGAAAQYRLTDTAAGEYVEYTIEVAATDDYQFDYRVSQDTAGGAFHAEVDGQTAGSLAVPNTGGFGTFGAVSQRVTLSAGRHVVRVAFDTAAANGQVAGLDSISISEAPEVPPPPPPPGLTGDAATVQGGLSARQNFAAANELFVRRGRSASNTQWTYLKFDLSSVTAVTSAKLRLTGRLSDAAVPSLTTNLYSLASAKKTWDESTLTWKNKPGAKKLRGALAVTGTTDAAYEVDLTAFLQAEFAAGRKVVTLVLKNVVKSDTQSVFASDESATPPALVIA